MKHYRDCPLNCNAQGKIFDRATKTLIFCPHCEGVRKEELESGVVKTDKGETVDFKTTLGFKNTYLTGYYEFDNLLHETEKDLLDTETSRTVNEAIEDLLSILATGELPTQSYCFGLARKGSIEHLAYPLLSRAYKKGIQGCRLVSSRFYYSMYRRGSDVQDLYDMELICVHIASGSSYDELMTIKGLMETRAVDGKPTIFITNADIDDCLLLLGSNSQPSLYLASPYFLERRSNLNNHSFMSDSLRGIKSTNGSKVELTDVSDPLHAELQNI